MFDLKLELQNELIGMRQRGAKPSQLLRHLIARVPDLHSHSHELMFYLHKTFHVPFSELTCIQHWRHDGLGGLDDTKIDMYIEPALVEVEARNNKGAK